MYLNEPRKANTAKNKTANSSTGNDSAIERANSVEYDSAKDGSEKIIDKYEYAPDAKNASTA